MRNTIILLSRIVIPVAIGILMSLMIITLYEQNHKTGVIAFAATMAIGCLTLLVEAWSHKTIIESSRKDIERSIEN